MKNQPMKNQRITGGLMVTASIPAQGQGRDQGPERTCSVPTVLKGLARAARHKKK